MIPQRTQGREGYGNGVSCRVEACRKRLRSIRSNHVAASQHDHGEDGFGTPAAGAAATSTPGKPGFMTKFAEGNDEAGLT